MGSIEHLMMTKPGGRHPQQNGHAKPLDSVQGRRAEHLAEAWGGWAGLRSFVALRMKRRGPEPSRAVLSLAEELGLRAMSKSSNHNFRMILLNTLLVGFLACPLNCS